jgi:hypothetical protein
MDELEHLLSSAETKIRMQSRTIVEMKRSIVDLLGMIQKISPDGEFFSGIWTKCWIVHDHQQ